MTLVEFSRPLLLDEIGDGVVRTIEADSHERAALAGRFNLRALDALAARFEVLPIAGGFRVTGKMTARAVQACVISNVDVASAIDEPVDLMLRSDIAGEADEIELGAEECDVLPLDGGVIDLGEVAAQTLGIALDPYPRAGAAQLAEARRLLVSEEDALRASTAAKTAANPFAILKRGND